MTENTPQGKETSGPLSKQESLAVRKERTPSRLGDILKLCVAVALISGGMWVFYNHNTLGLPAYLRMASPVLGVVLALLIIFYWCDFGRRLVAYVRDSVAEFKKVVWPDRRDAFRMTIFVIIFVTILAAFIYMADSVISWLFYDVLLKRG